jgi:hypothetical protein
MLRKVGLLALVLALTLLASGAAQAKPLAGSARPSESHGIMPRIWDWIGSLFRVGSSPSGEIRSTWEADGSHLDPHG